MSRNDGRTEQPTARRLKEANDRGQVARSQELGVAGSLVAALLVAVAFGPAMWRTLQHDTAALLTLDATGASPRALLLSTAARMIVTVVGPFAVAGALAGTVANVAQVGLRLRPKAARPQLSRISPRNGLQRLKPSTSLWELGRTAIKIGLVVAVAWSPLTSWRADLQRGWSFDSGMEATGAILTTIVIRVIAVSALVAAADYAWNRRKHMRDLRMTKQEVRQELKDQTGDPLLRSRRADRARQLTRNRMLAGVAQADVVVTNPTRLAVALKYTPSEPAPRVIAKGADRAAAKIRAEARRHGVLVTENVPLARALFRRVRPGDYVPHALFEAVAVVLAMVYRRRAAAARPTATANAAAMRPTVAAGAPIMRPAIAGGSR